MNIIVYVKTGCPWCIGVTEFLKEKGITFEERNVSENDVWFEEMQQKSGQTKAPTIDIDGDIYGDSDVEQLMGLLKARGVVL